MKLINYDYFDEKYYYEELSNGLKVYIFHKPDYISSSVAFGTPYGALDIHQKFNGKHYDFNPGIAHFLEHKVFESEDGDVINKFAAYGANVNAFTSYRETVYHFFMSQEEHFFTNLEMLLDFVQELNITEETVDKEKGIINQEIAMYQQNPLTKLLNETNYALYHNFPMKYDIGGSKDTVNATTKAELETCYNINYHPSNMVLSIVSFIDPYKIMEVIKTNQSKKNFNKIEVAVSDNEIEPSEVRIKDYHFKMDVNSPKVIYAVKLNYSGLSNEQLIKTEFAIKTYLQTCFSNLNKDYQKWLDDGIINDFFGFEVEIEDDYAYILFYAEKSDANELKTLIDNTLGDFKPDKEKFNQLKRRFVGEFFNEFSDLEGFNITFLRNILDNSNMFEVYDIIHKITYDEMLDIFNDVDFSNFSLVTLDANIVE